MNSSVQYPSYYLRQIVSVRMILALFSICVIGCGDNNASSPSRGESVTGTFLEPAPDFAGNETGFIALDEECGHTDDPLYMNRFITSMFRDGIVVANMLYLVDGSYLWSLDISNLNHPVRTSLLPLPGEAVAITSDNDVTLWVAAGSAGIIELDIRTPEAPVLTHEYESNGIILDLAYDNRLLYAAAGNDGIHILDTTFADAPLTPLAQLNVSGFPNGITVADDIVYVSACGALHIIDASLPHAPQVLGRYILPTGHAKDVHVRNNVLFVSAGEMLVALDITNPEAALIKGYYSDPEAEGFYVNGAVALNDTVFIAAGDESVRAVSTASLAGTPGEPAEALTADEAPPVVDGPFDFETITGATMSTVQITYGDPINVVRSDETLFVLGNFRWAGERLVRIFRIGDTGKITDIGEYVQPKNATYLNAAEGMTVEQQNGRTIHISRDTKDASNDSATGWPDTTLDFSAPLIDTTIDSERIRLLASTGDVYQLTLDGVLTKVEALRTVTAIESLSTGALITADAASNCIWRRTDTETQNIICTENRFWGHARLASFAGVLVAYNPQTGELLRYDDQIKTEATVRFVGMCENYRLDDFYSSASESKAVLAVNADTIHLLCPSDISENAVIMQFGNSNALEPKSTMTLPSTMYRDIALNNGDAYVLSTDNNRYSFSIARVTGNTTETVASKTGYATQLVKGINDILVGDNDSGIRRFDIQPDGGVEEVMP